MRHSREDIKKHVESTDRMHCVESIVDATVGKLKSKQTLDAVPLLSPNCGIIHTYKTTKVNQMTRNKCKRRGRLGGRSNCRPTCKWSKKKTNRMIQMKKMLPKP